MALLEYFVVVPTETQTGLAYQMLTTTAVPFGMKKPLYSSSCITVWGGPSTRHDGWNETMSREETYEHGRTDKQKYSKHKGCSVRSENSETESARTVIRETDAGPMGCVVWRREEKFETEDVLGLGMCGDWGKWASQYYSPSKLMKGIDRT